jgi:hypothetical protein
LETEGAVIADGAGLGHERTDVVAAATERLDEFVPAEILGVAGVGAVDGDEVQAWQGFLDERQRIALGSFDFEPVAEIEGHAQVRVVDLAGDAHASLEARGPEAGMRIERDLHALGPGIGDQLAELRHDHGVAVFRRHPEPQRELHLVDRQPQRAAGAGKVIDGLREFGR